MDQHATVAPVLGSGMKRKFEHALDLLDSALVTPTAIVAPKRPRKSPYTFLSSFESARKAAPDSATTPTLSAIITRHGGRALSSSPSAVVSQPSSSDYRPSSVSSFLSRLLTYKLTTYSNKPSVINAVAASRAGWVNEGKDRLVCYICHASFVVASTSGLTAAAVDTLIEKQRQGLVSNHKPGCPWRERQCEPAIYRIPLKSPASMIEDITAHAEHIEQMLSLSNMRYKHPLSKVQLDQLFSVAFPSDEDSLAHHASILLSLFGWRASRSTRNERPRISLSSSFSSPSISQPSSPVRPRVKRKSMVSSISYDSISRCGSPTPSFSSVSDFVSKNQVVSCSLCQRRVGLWTYVAERPENADGPGSSEGLSAKAIRSFDVLAEHRSYCPYVVVGPSLSSPGSTDQENTGQGMEGWRVVMDVVLRYNLGVRTRNAPHGCDSEGIPTRNDSVLQTMVDTVKSDGGRELMSYVKRFLA